MAHASVERSSPSATARGARRFAIAYAAGGPGVQVARVVAIVRIQMPGSRRNSSGDSRCTGKRVEQRVEQPADQPHVVVQRQPGHAGRALAGQGSAVLIASQVEQQPVVRDHHARAAAPCCRW